MRRGVRGKNRNFQKILIRLWPDAYASGSVFKYTIFRPNAQVGPIIEGHRFLPFGRKKKIRNEKHEIRNNFQK